MLVLIDILYDLHENGLTFLYYVRYVSHKSSVTEETEQSQKQSKWRIPFSTCTSTTTFQPSEGHILSIWKYTFIAKILGHPCRPNQHPKSHGSKECMRKLPSNKANQKICSSSSHHAALRGLHLNFPRLHLEGILIVQYPIEEFLHLSVSLEPITTPGPDWMRL